jgi:hypothetical protein
MGCTANPIARHLTQILVVFVIKSKINLHGPNFGLHPKT